MPVHLLPAAQSQRPVDYEPEPSGSLPNRRQFLMGVAALGATPLGIPSRDDVELPKASPNSGWYAMVSDIHIAANVEHRVFHNNMANHFKAVVADILAEKEAPRGVIIAGDLAVWDGQTGDYKTLLKLLEPLRAAEIPIHMALGNHDHRERFREALPLDTLLADHQISAVEGTGIRFILLDSLDKVAQTPGKLGQAQLEWLAKDLDDHAKVPTVLIVHHHPNFVHWSTVPGLKDAESLMKVITPRNQVKAVFFGHTHSFHIHNEAGIYLINLPAVGYSLDHRSRLGYCRFRPKGHLAESTLRSVDGSEWPHGKRFLHLRDG